MTPSLLPDARSLKRHKIINVFKDIKFTKESGEDEWLAFINKKRHQWHIENNSISETNTHGPNTSCSSGAGIQRISYESCMGRTRQPNKQDCSYPKESKEIQRYKAHIETKRTQDWVREKCPMQTQVRELRQMPHWWNRMHECKLATRGVICQATSRHEGMFRILALFK